MNNRLCRTIDYEITHVVPIKYEIYSFIDIVSNYFNLQPNLSERIKYIFNEIWRKYTTFFNVIRYENAVLGVMLFVVEEFYKEMGIDLIPIDVTGYVMLMYGKNNIEKNMVQVYIVYQNVTEIFNKSGLIDYECN